MHKNNEEEYNTGILPDTRPASEKEKDWEYSEIASGDQVILRPIESFEEFSIQNQVNSSSCVWQAIAKAHEVKRFRFRGEKINHSAGGYSLRSNKPGEGSIVPEALQQAVTHGVPFEEDIPSEGMSESSMNQIKYLDLMKNIPERRKTFTNGYIPYMPLKFDAALKEVASGNVVLLLVRCNILEWNQGAPQVYGGVENVSHEVAGVQAGLFTGELRGNKGEKLQYSNEPVLIIHDSWGNLGYKSKGIRIITKKFFEAKVDVMSMFVGFTYNEGSAVKPTIPTLTTTYGQTGANVKRLQECLKYLGYFPLDIDLNISSNNRFGNVTRTHLKRFQLAHKDLFISLGAKLVDLNGMSAGPVTRKVLGQLIK